MVNTLCGFPIEHTGGHIAIRHDSRIHMENMERRKITMLKSAMLKSARFHHAEKRKDGWPNSEA